MPVLREPTGPRAGLSDTRCGQNPRAINSPPTTAELLAQAREATEIARSACAESRRLVTSSRATRAAASRTRQAIHRGPARLRRDGPDREHGLAAQRRRRGPSCPGERRSRRDLSAMPSGAPVLFEPGDVLEARAVDVLADEHPPRRELRPHARHPDMRVTATDPLDPALVLRLKLVVELRADPLADLGERRTGVQPRRHTTQERGDDAARDRRGFDEPAFDEQAHSRVPQRGPLPPVTGTASMVSRAVRNGFAARSGA
jgi:hypothetical protein